MANIKLGDKVKDQITGIQGVVTARHEFLNNPPACTVECQWNENAGRSPSYMIEEIRLSFEGRSDFSRQGNEIQSQKEKEKEHA